MPRRALRPCGQPGCPELVTTAKCPTHASAERKKYDGTRGTAAQRNYGSEWQKAREQHLAEEPLCRMCAKMGRVTAATVVDHIIPHKGDLELFWDRTNWQSLCKPHHDSEKQREENVHAPGGSNPSNPSGFRPGPQSFFHADEFEGKRRNG